MPDLTPPPTSSYHNPLTSPIATLILLSLLYLSLKAYTRLYHSPLTPFPGPKLAALTSWYQFYHDIFPHYGQYYARIAELHTVYGPILRISPDEIHISTPDFFPTLYCSAREGKRDKWAWLTHSFGMNGSTFATVECEVHRRRRAALGVCFSKSSVARLEGVVRERVGVFVQRVRELGREGRVQGVAEVASAFSTDVIMTYAFGRCDHRLENPDFGATIYEAGHQGGLLGPVIMHMKWILWIIQSLPTSVVKKLDPAMRAFVELRQGFEKQVLVVMSEKDHAHHDQEHATIFHELLHSKVLPDADKSIARLSDEALSVVSAGNETVSWALTVATYHILADAAIARALKTELKAAMPDPEMHVSATALEQLPYLNAVYKEALRLSYGMTCRLQRVPHEPLRFESGGREWVIPAGTPVSMTSLLIHHDESIFPNSREFRPERWIGNPGLWRYMVSYGAGSRVCLGQSLASSEMHLWLAALFRRFGTAEVRFEDDEGVVELVDTDVSDVACVADRIIPAVKKGSKGVRIRVSLNT